MQSGSMQSGKKEFKVGQEWRTRDGDIIQIEVLDSKEVSTVYPIKSTGGQYWTEKGYYYYDEGEHACDLVELIERVASEDKESTNKYSVEEVITALYKISGDSFSSYEQDVQDVEEYLFKAQDPEYQKYLELKAKFE